MSRARLPLLLAVAALAGCGDSGGEDQDSASDAGVEEQQEREQNAEAARAERAKKAAAAKRLRARNKQRARSLTKWFREQQMTPSDLYAEGIDAPESMLKVYAIKRISVSGSEVTLHTDLYPKAENKNEFQGACNQVISGYGGVAEAEWIKGVYVIGQDGSQHGRWEDEDQDGGDDSTGLIACQSDL